MGQQSSKIHLEIFGPIKLDDTTPGSTTSLLESNEDDISFFFPSKVSDDGTASIVESGTNHAVLNVEKIFLKSIQNHLALLTKAVTWEEIDTQINELMTNNVFILVKDSYEGAMKQIIDICERQQLLRKSLANKLKEEKLDDMSIFAKSSVDSSSGTQIDNNDDQQVKKDKENQRKAQQLSYFAMQFLTSILLILIESAEKTDPTIIRQILTLTSQLCEQMPLQCLSSSSNSNLLLKSLKPLTNYINELSLSNDPYIAKETLKIQLSFSTAKGSLKDILPLLNKLIFNTVDVHNIRGLLIQLNDGLTEAISQRAEEEKSQPAADATSDQNADEQGASKEKTG